MRIMTKKLQTLLTVIVKSRQIMLCDFEEGNVGIFKRT